MLARALNKKLFGVLIDPMKTIDALPDQLKGVWQIVDLAGGQDHRLFRAKIPDPSKRDTSPTEIRP